MPPHSWPGQCFKGGSKVSRQDEASFIVCIQWLQGQGQMAGSARAEREVALDLAAAGIALVVDLVPAVVADDLGRARVSMATRGRGGGERATHHVGAGRVAGEGALGGADVVDAARRRARGRGARGQQGGEGAGHEGDEVHAGRFREQVAAVNRGWLEAEVPGRAGLLWRDGGWGFYVCSIVSLVVCVQVHAATGATLTVTRTRRQC